MQVYQSKRHLKKLEFVPHVANIFTVEDLTYLRDGGRISGIVYLLGTTLRIKPILAADDEGEIKLRTNSFGRRKSLNSLVKRVVTTYEPKYGKEIFISHGDCLEDAIYVKNAIEKELNLEIDLINVMESGYRNSWRTRNSCCFYQ